MGRRTPLGASRLARSERESGGVNARIKRRNPVLVIILSFITFGIYGFYWMVVTKNEMNRLGADIPTAWLIIIPIINFYWLYKYCDGFAKSVVRSGSGILWFLICFVPVGGLVFTILVQMELNKLTTR